jgi:1-acyl-sn-glycerol-3-phosphate acyltransferase
LGIRVVSQGIMRSGPSLVVANRLCWLDVLVLAAAGPMVPLADSRVRRGSPIAPIAARVGAVFVGVTSPRQLPGTIEQITATLRGGHRVLAFPEGDQCLGSDREPFHCAVFQSAVDAATVVSPVALSYHGPSVGDCRIDEALLSSLWHTLRGGPLTVQVQWLPVIPAVAGPGHRSDHRAAAAARAEWAIAHALADRLWAAGRVGPADADASLDWVEGGSRGRCVDVARTELSAPLSPPPPKESPWQPLT